NAEKLMDYYYEPEVAARLAAWVNYICPVAGAEEAMEEIDPSLVGNTLIFPDEQMLSPAWEFQSIDEDTRRRDEGDFRRAMSASPRPVWRPPAGPAAGPSAGAGLAPTGRVATRPAAEVRRLAELGAAGVARGVDRDVRRGG